MVRMGGILYSVVNNCLEQNSMAMFWNLSNGNHISTAVNGISENVFNIIYFDICSFSTDFIIGEIVCLSLFKQQQ